MKPRGNYGYDLERDFLFTPKITTRSVSAGKCLLASPRIDHLKRWSTASLASPRITHYPFCFCWDGSLVCARITAHRPVSSCISLVLLSRNTPNDIPREVGTEIEMKKKKGKNQTNKNQKSISDDVQLKKK